MTESGSGKATSLHMLFAVLTFSRLQYRGQNAENNREARGGLPVGHEGSMHDAVPRDTDNCADRERT